MSSDIQKQLADHAVTMALLKNQDAQREADDRKRQEDLEIAKRVMAEGIQDVLQRVVRPILEDRKSTLEDANYDVTLTEVKREGRHGFRELSIGLEFSMKGQRVSRQTDSIVTYSLVFRADYQTGAITAGADTGKGCILVPGVDHMAYKSLDQGRVIFTFDQEFLPKVLKNEQSLNG